MIVFDLLCADGDHRFEGWFASSQDFANQQQRGLLCCPICGSADVVKAVMAPAVGRKGNQQAMPSPIPFNAEPAAPIQQAGDMPAPMRDAMRALAKAQAEMLPKSRWVGAQFAEQARAIHYGEADAELIHGRTTPAEAKALHEEGVTVAPLVVPFVPPEEKN